MKQKIQVLIPLLLVAGMLIYCWTIFFTGDLIANWHHYLGIVLYSITLTIFFTNLRLATFVLGVYLLLATFNLLAITPTITTSWFNIGPISTPPVQLPSLALFILYLVLNFDSMIEYYLDYKKKNKINKSRN